MQETNETKVNPIDWTDNEWERFKSWLENLLYQETVEVIFTKVDGTVRTMQATKSSSIVRSAMERKLVLDLPLPGQPAKEKRTRRQPENKLNITVWDIEKDDWRTIKVKNIQNVLILILKYDYKPSKPFFELDIFD